MKITESQLRKIIREELEAVREADAPKLFFVGLYRKGFEDEGGEFFRKKFETAEQAKAYAEENYEGEYDYLKIYDDVPGRGVEPVLTSDAPLREVKIADFVDRYKEIANKAGFYYPPGGVVNNLARRAADARDKKIPTEDQMAAFRNQAAKELGMPAGPMDEEKTDPIPLRTIFLDDEVNAAIDAGRSRRAARGIPDPTPQIIRTRLNAILGQKAGEGIASYQGDSASPKRKLMIRTAIKAYENKYTRRKRR